MLLEKKIVIGLSIISELINFYDNGDSAINTEQVVQKIKKNFNFEPTYKEIEEMIDFLNSTSPRHDVVRMEWTYNLDMIIITEREEKSLIVVQNQLQEELDKLSSLI